MSLNPHQKQLIENKTLLSATTVLNRNISAFKSHLISNTNADQKWYTVFKKRTGWSWSTNFKRQSHSVMLTELSKFPVPVPVLYIDKQDQSLCIKKKNNNNYDPLKQRSALW